MNTPLIRAIAAALSLALAAPAAHAAPVGGIDLFELHPGADTTRFAMESTWELGQLALKVDGGSDTRPMFDSAQVQLLWMPQVAPGVKLAFGPRHDIRPGENLTHAVAGIEADLTPWLTGEHYVYLSQRGDLTGGGKLVARFALASALVLEPRIQLDWSAQPIPRESLASGPTGLKLSARLRRSLGPHVDVYAGAVHDRVLGGTAALAREGGSPVTVTRAVIGAGFSL